MFANKKLLELDNLTPKMKLTVNAKHSDGSEFKFQVLSRLDSQVEIDYYRNGGILHTVLRNMVKD